MIRFVLGNLRMVVRILSGGAKNEPHRELGPYQMWARAAEECGVENVAIQRTSPVASSQM